MSRSFNKRSTAADVAGGLDLSGKTYLVTGANSGLGFQTAKAIASSGGHVVMACRNLETAEDARKAIVGNNVNLKVDLIQLDCSSLGSVRNCADCYREKGWPLHVLILNAGVFNPQPRQTADGYEGTFQINHLSQFYLANLLTDVMIQSKPARIVVVASMAHQSCYATTQDMHPAYLSPCPPQAAFKAYNLSKLLNMLFALEYNKRHASHGVNAYSLHPGIIKTNISRSSTGLRILIGLMTPTTVTVEQGAATQTYLATASDDEIQLNAGKYFQECKVKNVASRARSEESAARLWAVSEQMIKDFEAKSNQSRERERFGCLKFDQVVFYVDSAAVE